jgi:hypothetical protein
MVIRPIEPDLIRAIVGREVGPAIAFIQPDDVWLSRAREEDVHIAIPVEIAKARPTVGDDDAQVLVPVDVHHPMARVGCCA